jgi:hypothetical protein
MSTVSLTGNDTIVIGGRVFTDFGDGDIAKLTFPNDNWETVTGKNGNVIFVYNNKGAMAELELKLIRGSGDDIFLNTLATIARIDPPSATVLTGRFVKRIGTGIPAFVNNDVYVSSSGIIGKTPEVTSSSDGKTDDAQTVYKIKFGVMERFV